MSIRSKKYCEMWYNFKCGWASGHESSVTLSGFIFSKKSLYCYIDYDCFWKFITRRSPF